MKILCCILSYEITKGMKSRGPIGLLKKNNHTEELLLNQIRFMDKFFKKNDIYVITGFGADKITKKLPAHVSTIFNDRFNQANQGYAIKLLLKNLSDSIYQYDGIFILSTDVLLRNLPSSSFDKSWIITKNKHSRQAEDYLLGVGLDKEQKLHTIFYNVSNLLWCNAVYLCKKDLLEIVHNIDRYYDNMFLFEMLNKSIDLLNMNIGHHTLNSSDCIVVRGPKDKYKII